MVESKPKISLLICHLKKRADTLANLMEILDIQKAVFPIGAIEILVDAHPTDSVGTKRNRLLSKASGDYVAFIDDDDRISLYYLPYLYEGILKGVDCCSLTGEITEDGVNPLIFQHSIKYKEYKTNKHLINPVRYERYPNHLNCIKASIAKQFKFPEINVSEDTAWATKIFNSGLIKTEHWIEDVIYYYDYRSKK